MPESVRKTQRMRQQEATNSYSQKAEKIYFDYCEVKNDTVIVQRSMKPVLTTV